MSITSKFIKEFKPDSVDHVAWLARRMDMAESMSPDKPGMLIEEINNNPMNIELEQRDALDWPHIHFCLCGVYAKATLRGKAYIPKL